jgi:hypothetical protein
VVATTGITSAERSRPEGAQDNRWSNKHPRLVYRPCRGLYSGCAVFPVVATTGQFPFAPPAQKIDDFVICCRYSFPQLSS